MSKRRLTEEQINEISKNKNVARCSDKAISYNKDFKIRAVKLYQENGMPANQIFKEAGFNLDVIGREVPKDLLYDWTRIFKTKGADGLLIEARGKGKGGGRPKSKWLTKKEQIKYLETQVAYLKAENDFLAKPRKKSLN